MGSKARVFGMLVMALAVATTAYGAPKRIITRPDWARKPTGDEMAALYPQKAREENRSGKVRLTCKVRTDGSLVDCKARRADPKGYGFEQAALELSKTFLMKPKAIDGQPVDGGVVTIPIVFAAPAWGEPRLGDSAAVMTRIGTAATPTATGPTFPCFDGIGECQPHPLFWAEQPPAQLTRRILGSDAPTTGITILICTVGVDGSLQGCDVRGDELSPRARAIIDMTLSRLRAPATTLDGLETSLQTIAVPFEWDKIAAWPSVRRR